MNIAALKLIQRAEMEIATAMQMSQDFKPSADLTRDIFEFSNQMSMVFGLIIPFMPINVVEMPEASGIKRLKYANSYGLTSKEKAALQTMIERFNDTQIMFETRVQSAYAQQKAQKQSGPQRTASGLFIP